MNFPKYNILHSLRTDHIVTENLNKHVETLDDEKLRALLDEAITYKLVDENWELLEEVEQDEQACEAAARNLTGCRGSRRGARGRRALPHSNSLQDLVAALAAEPAPRHTRHHPRHHAPAPSNVSARAIHGGSLPSGVDTSSLLSEEGSGAGSGAGYLATVRCVNPPPLAERRVSASDANAPHELELLNRRSKPMSPMTYTARATLEIGSGSVCSGRAVTTTTASNQVRTLAHPPPRHGPSRARARAHSLTHGPPERLYQRLYDPTRNTHGGGMAKQGKRPRGPTDFTDQENTSTYIPNEEWDYQDSQNQLYQQSVDMWYQGLSTYDRPHVARENARWMTNMDDNARSRSAPLSTSYQDYARRRSTELCALDSKYFDNGVESDGNLYRVEGHSKFSDNNEGDISLRKNYRKIIGKSLVAPTLSMINPRNVKSMTIGEPLPYLKQLDSQVIAEKATDNGEHKNDNSKADIITSTDSQSDSKENVSIPNEICIEIENKIAMSLEDQTSKCFQMSNSTAPAGPGAREALGPPHAIELEEIVCHRANKDNHTASSFTEYLAGQKKLLQAIEATEASPAVDEYSINVAESNNNVSRKYSDRETARDVSSDTDLTEIETIDLDATEDADGEQRLVLNRKADDRAGGDRYILAELPNNAYIFLTLPKRLLNKDDRELHEIESNNNVKPIEGKKRKKDKVPVGTSSSKRTDMINRNALRVLLFENLLKSDREMSGHGSADNEVDSAIPFSCITTPEVVTSCNTTSSSSTAVAIDPKPLQLGSGYRAVASLTGSPPSTSSSPPIARPSSSVHDVPELQPRSVIASSFNGLPLSRPNYGSTASSNDEYKLALTLVSVLINALMVNEPIIRKLNRFLNKINLLSIVFQKSLDENGNAVQGFSSPLSGSSQHKKPRRKKSSKNETVIDCQQLDGYRGDKADVNELLRFIESNPETRGPKMRAKHKDDADDKATKKRSSERRKDKEKVKRASSLEELSRTKLEDLTARAAPAPKPERRSWGDASPSAPAPIPPPAPAPAPASLPEPKPATPPPETEPEIEEPIELPAALELPALPLPDPIVEQADFQTVTKKRKPRRRTEEAPRRTRLPSPRRQESAPPSDRSNDSNDDMDSVHSLPQPGAAVPVVPHASYADIARTRHNIPDLIESCNYYNEGESNGEIRRVEIPAPIETDGYPALETKIPDPPPPAVPRRRELKQAPPPRRDRKERAIQAAPPSAPDCPAPDVVADRRPPVILLDSSSRPRDMDGVTFGFDINEQLLAWEDVVRCGVGKVRYFSE
ncbi:Uncharacterized protein OBRU01_08217 [Operophtera brumata]|uniref:Uncharacterized protein n=1 Tax=Operophtera brumata TaxID=104452 RepID=A0A0L7LEU9_OPEBR|nr:Uncharacterized protein OBRU01_08217 [Operophtera brumata]